MVSTESSTPAKLLVTARDAAKALAISQRTLWTLTQSRKIRAVRVGKRGVRYSVAELERWIAVQENGGAPE